MKNNDKKLDESVDPNFVEEDPWEKLSDDERKKAERHLKILYGVMILFVILPFIVFFLTRRS